MRWATWLVLVAELGVGGLAAAGCHAASGLDDFSIEEGAAGGAAGVGGGGGAGGAGGSADPRCGDGTRDAGEACDDGDADETNGCTSECEIQCPSSDWVKLDSTGHCYLYVASVARSDWDTALGTCSSLNVTPPAYLATITSGEELTLGGDLAPADASSWVGATDRAVEAIWVWHNDEEWTWALNVSPPWLSPAEPSGGNEHCLELLDDGLFNDTLCTSMRRPLCEYEPAGL